MWAINHLYLQNVMAFKESEYTFENGVVTLVYGENMDNESQLSNGSGKSAFSEAIAIALTGTPLRNVKQDEIINNDTQSATVRLTLYNKATGQSMIVSRSIFKGNKPQKVSVSFSIDGNEEPYVLSGVDEYNKFILETIGITKDELYSSFILCRSRYSDFLLASDKEKKEIINKFSRGNMVDQAIERLRVDLESKRVEYQNINSELNKLEGRRSLLESQIEEAKMTAEKTTNKNAEMRISLMERINADKKKIEEINGRMEEKKNLMTLTAQHINELNDFEGRNYDGLDIEGIKAYLKGKQYLPNFQFVQYDSAMTKYNIQEIDSKIELEKTLLQSLYDESNVIKKELEKVTAELETIDLEIEKNKELQLEEANRNKELANKFNQELTALQDYRRNCRVESDKLKIKCESSIKCPKCHADFVVGDASFDLVAAKERIEFLKQEMDSCEQKISDLGDKCDHIYDKYNELYLYSQDLQEKRSVIFSSLSKVRGKVDENVRAINRACSAVNDYTKRKEYLESSLASMVEDMISAYFTQLEGSYNTAMKEFRNLRDERDFHETRITDAHEYMMNLKDMDAETYTKSLRDKLEETVKELTSVSDQASGVNNQIETYNLQEKRFIEFKTYLANGKIDSLSMITNQFLEQIGSDLRVRFDGYSVLKSGKIRDKISIAVLRDGMEIGSIGKLSVGEMSRVQLSVILAMHKLINLNADNDKGLDFLLIDEVLDGVDESGLANIVKSINDIGITSIIISHGKLAESYRYTLTIRKKNGVSSIHE